MGDLKSKQWDLQEIIKRITSTPAIVLDVSSSDEAVDSEDDFFYGGKCVISI